MVYVLVSTFAPPVKLKEMIEASGKKYAEIDVVTSTDVDQDDIVSTLSDVFTLPGQLVKKVLLEDDINIIYVKNDGTLDDEVVSTLIKEYFSMIGKVVDSVGNVVDIPTVRVISIKNKLTLLNIISSLETNQLDIPVSQSSSLQKMEDTSIEKKKQNKPVSTEIESVLEGDNEEDEELFVEIEEIKSKDENTKLFVVSVVDEDGDAVGNKVVELSIVSGDGVFASNGATSTRVKIDSRGAAVVKVLVPDPNTDIDFNYEIVQ